MTSGVNLVCASWSTSCGFRRIDKLVESERLRSKVQTTNIFFPCSKYQIIVYIFWSDVIKNRHHFTESEQFSERQRGSAHCYNQKSFYFFREARKEEEQVGKGQRRLQLPDPESEIWFIILLWKSLSLWVLTLFTHSLSSFLPSLEWG